MQEIVASLTTGLIARGWRTTHVQTDPLSGRFLVTDPDTGEECEVDVLKEAFWAPPAQTPYGPVLSLDDVIGTKVRALADRGTVRDLIGVQAASRHRSTADVIASIPSTAVATRGCGVASRFQPGAVHGGGCARRMCRAAERYLAVDSRRNWAAVTVKHCIPLSLPGPVRVPTVELGNGQLEELVGRLPAGSIDYQC